MKGKGLVVYLNMLMSYMRQSSCSIVAFPVLLIVHTLKKKHFDNNIPLRGREKLIVHPNVLKYDRWRFLSPTAFLPDVLLVYILRPREK